MTTYQPATPVLDIKEEREPQKKKKKNSKKKNKQSTTNKKNICVGLELG